MDTLFESTKDGKPKCPTFGGSGAEIKTYEEAVFLFNLQHKNSDRPGLVAAELLLNWSEDERKELYQIIGGIERLGDEVKSPAVVVKFAKQIAFGQKEEHSEMLLFFVKLMRLRLPSNATYKKILHLLEEAIKRFDSTMSSHEIVLTGRSWRPEGAPCLECGVRGKWNEHRAPTEADGPCSYDLPASFIPDTYFPPALRSLFLLYKLRLPQEELIRIMDKVPPYQYDQVSDMLRKKDTAVRMYKETNGSEGAAPVRQIDSFASDSDGEGYKRGYDSDMSDDTMCLVNRIAEKKGQRFFKRSFTQYRKDNKSKFQGAGVRKPFAKPIRSVSQAVKAFSKACWECGSAEHLARECPVRRARLANNPSQNVNMVSIFRTMIEEQYGPQEDADVAPPAAPKDEEPALDNNHVDTVQDYFGEDDVSDTTDVNAVGGENEDQIICRDAPPAGAEALAPFSFINPEQIRINEHFHRKKISECDEKLGQLLVEAKWDVDHPERAPDGLRLYQLGGKIAHLEDLLNEKLPSEPTTLEHILTDQGCAVRAENGFVPLDYRFGMVVAEDEQDEVYDVRGVAGIRASDISLEEAALDCGAAICVIGEERLHRLIQKRKKRGVDHPVILPSTRKMRYGNGQIGPSKGTAVFPLLNKQLRVTTTVEVIEGDTPLLICLPLLEQLNALLDFGKRQMFLRNGGKLHPVEILRPQGKRTYTIGIDPGGPRCFSRPHPQSAYFECLLCHLEDQNGCFRVGVREFIEGKYLGKGIVLPDDEIQPWCERLHKALGHAEKKVVVLLQQAQADPKIIMAYKDLCSRCDLCQKHKAAPRVHKAGIAASLGEQENQHWTTDVVFPEICGQTVEFIHTVDHFTKDSVVRYLPRMDSDCFIRHAVETTGYLHGAPSVEWRFDAGSNFVSQEARVELQALTDSCAILEGPVDDPTSQTYAERRGAWVKKLLKITGEDYFRLTGGRLPDWEVLAHRVTSIIERLPLSGGITPYQLRCRLVPRDFLPGETTEGQFLSPEGRRTGDLELFSMLARKAILQMRADEKIKLALSKYIPHAGLECEEGDRVRVWCPEKKECCRFGTFIERVNDRIAILKLDDSRQAERINRQWIGPIGMPATSASPSERLAEYVRTGQGSLVSGGGDGDHEVAAPGGAGDNAGVSIGGPDGVVAGETSTPGGASSGAGLHANQPRNAHRPLTARERGIQKGNVPLHEPRDASRELYREIHDALRSLSSRQTSIEIGSTGRTADGKLQYRQPGKRKELYCHLVSFCREHLGTTINACRLVWGTQSSSFDLRSHRRRQAAIAFWHDGSFRVLPYNPGFVHEKADCRQVLKEWRCDAVVTVAYDPEWNLAGNMSCGILRCGKCSKERTARWSEYEELRQRGGRFACGDLQGCSCYQREDRQVVWSIEHEKQVFPQRETQFGAGPGTALPGVLSEDEGGTGADVPLPPSSHAEASGESEPAAADGGLGQLTSSSSEAAEVAAAAKRRKITPVRAVSELVTVGESLDEGTLGCILAQAHARQGFVWSGYKQGRKGPSEKVVSFSIVVHPITGCVLEIRQQQGLKQGEHGVIVHHDRFWSGDLAGVSEILEARDVRGVYLDEQEYLDKLVCDEVPIEEAARIFFVEGSPEELDALEVSGGQDILRRQANDLGLECVFLVARELSEREVQEDPVDPGFAEAEKKEWQSFLENKSLKAIKRSAGTNVCKMRLVRTYKFENVDDPSEITRRKARAIIQGFKDGRLRSGLITDAPTVVLQSLRTMISIGVQKGWSHRMFDIPTAFLRGSLAQGRVCVEPPPILRKLMGLQDDEIVEADSSVYGLADAPRCFYLALRADLEKRGFVVSKLDPSVFLYFGDRAEGAGARPGSSGEDLFLEAVDEMITGAEGKCRYDLIDFLKKNVVESRTLKGFLCVHVDDVLAFGDDEFFGKKFQEMTEFWRVKPDSIHTGDLKYLGGSFRRTPTNGVKLAYQGHVDKIKRVEIPKDLDGKDFEDDALLSPRLHSECRSLLGLLSYICDHGHPLSSYEVNRCATRASAPTFGDLKELNTVAGRIKKMPMQILFEKQEEPYIAVHTDASFATGPRGRTPAGRVVCLASSRCREPENPACTDSTANLISWKSSHLERVVHSTKAAESLSVLQGIDSSFLLQFLWYEATGELLPIKLYTDCFSLVSNLTKISMPREKNLMLASESIKQFIEDGEAGGRVICHVASQYQCADGLTKAMTYKDEHLLYQLGHYGIMRGVLNRETKRPQKLKISNKHCWNSKSQNRTDKITPDESNVISATSGRVAAVVGDMLEKKKELNDPLSFL